MTNTSNNPRRRNVVRTTKDGHITTRCVVCKKSCTMPDEGIGRANIAAWETRHQHLATPDPAATAAALTANTAALQIATRPSRLARARTCIARVAADLADPGA